MITFIRSAFRHIGGVLITVLLLWALAVAVDPSNIGGLAPRIDHYSRYAWMWAVPVYLLFRLTGMKVMPTGASSGRERLLGKVLLFLVGGLLSVGLVASLVSA